MGDLLREEFQLTNFRLRYPDVGAFVRSQWNQSRWVYLSWRAFWLVWHLVWIVVSGVRTRNTAPDEDDGPKWFVKLSNVTFLLTTITCLVDFVLVLLSTCARDKSSANSMGIESKPSTSEVEREDILFHGEFTLVQGMKIPVTPWYFQLEWMLYEAMNCGNLLTTIIFWIAEYDGEVIHADVIVFNVVNTVFVILNLMVADYPVRLLHFIYPAFYAIAYILFNLIYYLCDGKDFDGSDVTLEGLDWGDALPTAVTIPVGLLVAVPLGHLVFLSLYTLRVYLATPKEELAGSGATFQPDTYRSRSSSGEIGRAPTGFGNEGFEMDVGRNSNQ